MKLSNVVATLSLTTMALFATFVFLLEGKREQFKREVEVRARLSQACVCSQRVQDCTHVREHPPRHACTH